jgi:hypothetical protein
LEPKFFKEDTIGVEQHGEVDLKAMPRWHVFTYMCTLLGCSRDVPQGNKGGGNFQSDNEEPKGNNALDIHLNLLVMAYL